MPMGSIFRPVLVATLFSLLLSNYLLVSGHYNNEEKGKLKQIGRDPGPPGKLEFGEPWPKPQIRHTYNDTFMIVRPHSFRFQTVNNTCDMIEAALKRYHKIIMRSSSYQKSGANSRALKAGGGFKGILDVLQVELLSPCEHMPHESMDETYTLKINDPGMERKGILIAKTNWGIIRGLETFSQLLFISDDNLSLRIKSTVILDYPRFSHRSVLLDTSRHFISMKLLKQNLDLMAMNKFNVFHWHIVDSQSFPYQSKKFPELSNKGAYHPHTHIYTQQNVEEIIEYARVKGIRVLPEFDTPGHTGAWGKGIPSLNPCYDKNGRLNGAHGPIDPTNEENFDFLKSFFDEIVSVFPDKYLHLGGDEVAYNYHCWENNPAVQKFMKSKSWTDCTKLEGYYMQRLVDIVKAYPKNVTSVVWQDVVDNGVHVNKDTIVHVWKLEGSQEEMGRVTSKGHRALTSACWYLNKISYGIDWHPYYDCDPHDFHGTDAQKRLVLGGGPAMWTEYVDSTNLISRLWPRASVPGERLWSNANVTDKKDAGKRLDEHRCRMIKRGFQAGPPNGPGFCSAEFN